MSPSQGKLTPPALPTRPSSLLFINTTEEQSNGRATEAARKLVRSHVMSAFYRQKSLSKEEQADLAERGKEATKGGTVGKFRLEGRTRTRSTKHVKTEPSWIEQKPQVTVGEPLRLSMNLPLEIASDIQMDPFGVTALPLDSRMQKLILHYGSVIPTTVHPIAFYTYHSQKTILSLAMPDEALLHSILAYSMIHKFCFQSDPEPSQLAKVRYAESNPEVLSHRTRAIHLINKKLNEGDASETIIATVLVLLLHHIWVGGKQEADIHFSGLRKLIELRGGLKTLSPSLAGGIAFHDRKRSMFNGSYPVFPMNPQTTTISDLIVPYSNDDSMFIHSPDYLLRLLGTELYQNLSDLRYFTDFINYYRSRANEFGSRETALFELWNTSLEHRFVSYIDSDLDIRVEARNFKEALRTTAVLWMNTGLWNFPVTTGLVITSASHLVEVLASSELGFWREEYTDIFLWMLIVGACCTTNEGTGRAFLVEQLRLIAVARKFKGTQDLVKALANFLYADGVYTIPLACLWKDIFK